MNGPREVPAFLLCKRNAPVFRLSHGTTCSGLITRKTCRRRYRFAGIEPVTPYVTPRYPISDQIYTKFNSNTAGISDIIGNGHERSVFGRADTRPSSSVLRKRRGWSERRTAGVVEWRIYTYLCRVTLLSN